MADNDLPPPLTPDDDLLQGLHGDRPLPKLAPRAKAAAGGAAAVQVDLTDEDEVPPHPSIVRELARDEASERRAPTLVVSRGGARWRWWLAGAALFGIGVLAAFAWVRPPGAEAPAAPPAAAAAIASHAAAKAVAETPSTPPSRATEAATEAVHVAPAAPSGARSTSPRSAPPLPSGSPKQDSARVL